jgi:nitrite reductase/ring-hydroxylating ferredoxin subunit
VTGGPVEIARYERRIAATLERVLENVRDWEHLPGLHASSFASVRCRRADARGWLATLRLAGGAEIDVAVEIAPDERSYHSRTVAGPGTGSDVLTFLEPAGTDATDISVRFLVPAAAARPETARAYLALYARLWDEDEAMMVRRQAFLDGNTPRVPRPGRREPLALGPAAALRASLPRTVRIGEDTLVVRAWRDRLVAHPVTCPHWGAALERAEIVDGALVCPWHGYRFDLASGRGPAGQRCRMPVRARVRRDADDDAWLELT